MLKKLTASVLTAVLTLPISFGAISPLATAAVAAGPHYSSTFGVDKATAKVGDTLSYTYNVVNDGDVNLTSVFISGHLSNFITLNSGSTTIVKGPYTVTGYTDAWITDGLNLGGLKPGQSAKVTFQATVKQGVALGSTIQTSIHTTTAELPTEVACAAYTTVGGSVSYKPSKTVDKATATIGETLTYTLKVVNTGDLTLHDPLIVDNLPKDVTYIPGSTTSDKGSSHVQVADTWLQNGFNLGNLEPGQTGTVIFKVQVASTAKDGEILENVGQFKNNELPNWIQCAATTTVVVKEQPKEKGFLKIFKFEDFNGNGVFETSTEHGVGGFTFHVTGPNGYDQTVVVASDGTWNSGELVPGSYTITEADKAGWTHTTSATATVTVVANQTTEARFGNKEAGEVIPTTLPKTGPEQLGLLGVLVAGPLGLAFRKLRKNI